jgi:hypothetical protein
MISEIDLLTEINLAFVNSMHPGDCVVPFDKHSMPSSYCSCWEKFHSKKWNDCDIKYLLAEQLNNVLLSARGAAYFCPAFLIGTLDIVSAGELFEFHEEYIFTPLTKKDNQRREVRKLFSSEQKIAIAKYLTVIAYGDSGSRGFEKAAASVALAEYWGDFLVSG